MHAQTARRNGGDYDFDYICVVESQKFPHWVEDRFNYQERFSNQKQKLSKRRSPWWKLPQVAMAAKGNSIGSITDLKTSALAAGRPDLAEELALELQAALDQLKHGTEPNQERITAIRKEVGAAPWLKSKLAKRVEDLPLHFDNVGSWLQALHSKVCQGQGIGSIVFYAFPQELVDGIVERTGGRPIMVRVPDLAEGEVEIGQDGRSFWSAVSPVPTARPMKDGSCTSRLRRAGTSTWTKSTGGPC